MPGATPIVHRDDHLVVADKPAGVLAVGPGSIHERLAAELGERLFIVHRLDRETSGLIAFARDAETHRYLSGRFEERAVAKVYLAAVSGHVEPATGSVDFALREFGSGRMGVDRKGKPSHTSYAVLERLTDADLVELRPHTGRRHQLRVHMHAIGHAVLGDPRYGNPRPVGGVERLMLHAAALSFAGPDGTPIAVQAATPSDFEAVVARLRGPGGSDGRASKLAGAEGFEPSIS